MSGVKKDEGKAPIIEGCVWVFPRALTEVALLSLKALQKYPSYDNWHQVENGFARYTNALGRHVVLEKIEGVDPEDGVDHAVKVAWNALARLELKLRGQG